MKVIPARNIMQMWQVYLVSPGKVLKTKGELPQKQPLGTNSSSSATPRHSSTTGFAKTFE